jgi:hypothetical protein
MGKASGIANLLFGLAPLLIALPFAAVAALNNLLPGAGLAVAFAAMLFGFAAFVVAKVTRFRSGHWFSFGWHGMPPFARRCYACGLAAIAFGAVGCLSSVILSSAPWR